MCIEYTSALLLAVRTATLLPGGLRVRPVPLVAGPPGAALSVDHSESFLNTINPGNSVDGTLVFDVPEGLAPAAVELHDSPFSGGATVTLAG